MRKLYNLLVVVGAIYISLTPNTSSAQFARDTAFCHSVVNHECIGAISNGDRISISTLPIIDGHRAIYFWGNLRNPSASAIVFFFSREGACYDSSPVSPNAKALRDVTGAEHVLGYLASLTFREVWHALGLSKLEVGAKDIKVNVVFIPEANEYRIHYYRYALCPGKFSARLVKSNGDPIPGNNDLDIVLVK